MTSSSHGLRKRTALAAAAVFCIYFAAILLVQVPYFGLPILYYDDGETLYHVYALLQGNLPYRDAYTHHFTGYILPLYVLAKIFGYSIDLVRWGFILNQAITAVGTFLCASLFFSRSRALIAGLLVLYARQPFVYSFFPLYQVAACFTVILYFSLCYLQTTRRREIFLAAIFASAAFCIDQRGLLLLAIPLGAILFSANRKIQTVTIAIGAFSVLPAMAAAALYRAGIFPPFIEQTITYPIFFRVGSLSFLDQLSVAFAAHQFLLSETPYLLTLALTGSAALAMRNTGQLPVPHVRALFTISAAALFGIVFLGGRDYAYYSIPWLPLLSLLALFSLHIFERSKLLTTAAFGLVLFPVIAVGLQYPAFLNFIPTLKSRDDGDVVAALLRARMKPEDSLFIFGYRPDIYALIPRLSSLPFVNPISIHPDTSIQIREERQKHIVPAQQREFIARFSSTPPDFVVFADLQLGDKDWSPSADYVKNALSSGYHLLQEYTGPIVEGKPSSLRVYQRNSPEFTANK